jgi:hypothetical protein
MNLALLQQYGSNSWRIHNYLLEQTAKNLEKALEDLKQLTVEVNRERKNFQVRSCPRILLLSARPCLLMSLSRRTLGLSSPPWRRVGLSSSRACCRLRWRTLRWRWRLTSSISRRSSFPTCKVLDTPSFPVKLRVLYCSPLYPSTI